MSYGSPINASLAKSSTEVTPKIGMGCTKLLWSDRIPFEVIEIVGSRDKIKHIVARRMKVNADPNKPNGIGHQNWQLSSNPDGEIAILKFRKSKNGWYQRTSDGKRWTDVCFMMGRAEYYYDWSF